MRYNEKRKCILKKKFRAKDHTCWQEKGEKEDKPFIIVCVATWCLNPGITSSCCFLLTLLCFLLTPSSRSLSQIPSKIYVSTCVITVSQVLPSQSLKPPSVIATQLGTSKIVIDTVISVHWSFRPPCTSSTALFLRSCFSSSNLHWLFGLWQIPRRYPWVSKKSLFSLLWSLAVYLFTALLRISWSLLATSRSFFFPHFLLCSGNIPNWVISIYVSTKGMVNCWSVLHLFTGTYCAMHCTEQRPKIETIHLNTLYLQCVCFPFRKKILFHL